MKVNKGRIITWSKRFGMAGFLFFLIKELVLLPMTGGMKKHKRIVSHLVVVLTLVLSIMVAVMMILNLGEGSGIDRKVAIFMVIIAASIVALGY